MVIGVRRGSDMLYRPLRRTQEDIFTVADWLQNIKFFETMADSLHKAIATCVKYRCYDQGENRKGFLW